MLTMAPGSFAASQWRAAACETMKDPVRLTSTMRRKSATLVSTAGRSTAMPAQLTTPARRCSAVIVRMAISIPASSVTSQRMPCATGRPRSRQAASRASRFMSMRNTTWPRSPRSRAVSRPMPDAPPAIATAPFPILLSAPSSRRGFAGDLAAPLQLLADHLLRDLAVGRLGQRLPEDEALWHLVAGDLAVEPPIEPEALGRDAGPGDADRIPHFPPQRVRHAADRDLADVGMLQDLLLDLPRVDVRPTGDVHV